MEAGTTIGHHHYNIMRQLGKGGMGEVCLQQRTPSWTVR